MDVNLSVISNRMRNGARRGFSLAQPAVFSATGTKMQDIHAGTGQCNGLVRALATKHAGVPKGRQRFPGGWETWYLIEQVNID